MEGHTKQARRIIIKKAKHNFSELIRSIDIKDTDEPLKADWEDNDLGLWNPYSKITCFILYLYSMEFGSPPLFADLNRVARDHDTSQLENLGPFAKCLSLITGGAERRRNPEDRIRTGSEIGGVKWNFAGCFFLWRGVQFKYEWLKPYKDHKMHNVYLPGNTSCSQDVTVALNFAFNNLKKDMRPVLFAICSQNYYNRDGIRMNNEAYSSYPSEEEYLLTEGCEVTILAMDEKVKIKNKCQVFEKYNNRTIDIVHVFNF